MVSAESQTGPHPYTHHVSTAYLASLGLSMTAIFASRLLLRWVPLRNVATRISIFDAVVLILGLLGLGLHCGAMFFRSQFRSFPGGHLVIRSVDPLGTTSIVWFAITAVLVLFGLRRQIAGVCGVIAVALALVGITMYDGGSLKAHLTAIFVSVIALTCVVATLVLPPWSHRPLDETSTPAT
jgi:hypothetical protein